MGPLGLPIKDALVAIHGSGVHEEPHQVKAIANAITGGAASLRGLLQTRELPETCAPYGDVPPEIFYAQGAPNSLFVKRKGGTPYTPPIRTKQQQHCDDVRP